jgi:hypothetical protein
MPKFPPALSARVFITMVGFGVVMPLLPFFVRSMKALERQLTLVLGHLGGHRHLAVLPMSHGITRWISGKPFRNASHLLLESGTVVETEDSRAVSSAVFERVYRPTGDEDERTFGRFEPLIVDLDAHRPIDDVPGMIVIMRMR